MTVPPLDRDAFLRLLGGVPAALPPLDPEVLDRVDLGDVVRENERQDPAGRLKASAYEKFEAGWRIAAGRTLQGKLVWDARRGLDRWMKR